VTKGIRRFLVWLAIWGVVGLLPPLAIADCWTDLPSQATQGLHISRDGPFPHDGVCRSIVSADFTGDGQEDYALLVTPAEGDAGSALILVVKSEQWTLQVVRRWPPTASPTSVRVLPAGRYLRPGSILEALEDGEIPNLVATRVGLQAGSWAYFWQRGRWISVRLAR
jgi:hypothetical protein